MTFSFCMSPPLCLPVCLSVCLPVCRPEVSLYGWQNVFFFLSLSFSLCFSASWGVPVLLTERSLSVSVSFYFSSSYGGPVRLTERSLCVSLCVSLRPEVSLCGWQNVLSLCVSLRPMGPCEVDRTCSLCLCLCLFLFVLWCLCVVDRTFSLCFSLSYGSLCGWQNVLSLSLSVRFSSSYGVPVRLTGR